MFFAGKRSDIEEVEALFLILDKLLAIAIITDRLILGEGCDYSMTLYVAVKLQAYSDKGANIVLIGIVITST